MQQMPIIRKTVKSLKYKLINNKLTITLLITAGFITGGDGISLFCDTCLTGIL